MELTKENSEDETDVPIRPPACDWLKDANIFNQNHKQIPISSIMNGVDALILYFSMLNADRFNIIQKFYEIYMNTKHLNLPVEVINIPMDDNKQDMWKSFEEQPNWCTLKHGDPLIPILQYRYGITSVPHLLVMHPSGTIISSHGILDIDVYGRNALIAWMTTPVVTRKRKTRDLSLLGVNMVSKEKYQVQKKFIVKPKNTFSNLTTEEKFVGNRVTL